MPLIDYVSVEASPKQLILNYPMICPTSLEGSKAEIQPTGPPEGTPGTKQLIGRRKQESDLSGSSDFSTLGYSPTHFFPS